MVFFRRTECASLGISYIEEGNQVSRHKAVLDGDAGNPRQYRILSNYIAEGTIQILKSLGVPRHTAVSFILLRFFLDSAIFLFLFLYYRKLGISAPLAVIGMSVLAWGMGYAYYDCDLAFHTYFDVLFYILAGLCILYNKPIWIVPIAFFAAINRETSGLIPFIFLFASVKTRGFQKNSIAVFGAALLLYFAVFITLRLVYGLQELIIPYGRHPGIDLLKYNLGRMFTWHQLFKTLGIIPILAVIGYKKWHPQLRIFFWVIVPFWFLIHMFGAVMAETRLFLVPQALIFIPGALFFARRCESVNSSQEFLGEDPPAMY